MIDWLIVESLNSHLIAHQYKRLLGYQGVIICEDVDFISNQEITTINRKNIISEDLRGLKDKDHEYCLYKMVIDHNNKTITYLVNHKWVKFLENLPMVIDLKLTEDSLLFSTINELEKVDQNMTIKHITAYYDTFLVVELVNKMDFEA